MKHLPIVLLCIVLTSCVSRLRRPGLYGTIADFEGNPVTNCTVGETKTDENGYFRLPEIRYRQFLLTEMFQMEAPPLFIFEVIDKKGYVPKEIVAFSSFGGGARKGAEWNLDTIHLKKEDQKPINTLVKQWRIHAYNTSDTLYFLKDEHRGCMDRKCGDIHNKRKAYNAVHLSSLGNSDSAVPVMLKHFDALVAPENKFKIYRVTAYEDNEQGIIALKFQDSVHTEGSWQLNDSLLQLKSAIPELNGSFKAGEFDYHYMTWIRTVPNTR